jgi:AcrR family transcriptional regulator
MGSRERRTRERAETRQRIVDAARGMFVEHGYEATTMRAIADRIEYTPTAIYHHFRNKEELLSEVTGQDFRALAQAFLRIERVADPVERLRRISRAYIDFGVGHPMHYRFMFMTPHPPVNSGATGITPGDTGQDAYAILHQTCADAMAAGRFRPELTDAHEIAQILWSGCHGLVALRITTEHDEWVPWRDLRTVGGRLADVMLNGLLR